MKLNEYKNVIVDFIKDYSRKANCKKLVLGLSGGIDSSLVSCLCKEALGKENLICVIIPIHSLSIDLSDAVEFAKIMDLNYKIVNGDEIFDSYIKTLDSSGILFNLSTQSNLKARIRMSILYGIAQAEGALVVGTDNMDERYTGYFTKYGDGAADILPIAKLTKAEVIEMAELYGIPEKFSKRVPSAGLYPGQTDENEMGILYKDLDSFLLGDLSCLSNETINKINRLHNNSEHKRKEIPLPKDFDRE